MLSNHSKLAVIIDGGLGRCLCAIPALQQLAKTKEVIVLSGGWLEAYRGAGLTVYPLGLPSQDEMVEGYDVIKPEPYYDIDYREGSINMVTCFYKLLGVEPEDRGAVPVPFKTDTTKAASFPVTGKPLCVIQCHGAGGESDPRSMTNAELDTYVNKYYQSHTVVIVGTKTQFNYPEGTVMVHPELGPYFFFRYVQEAAVFVGCDSSGLHIRAAAGKPSEVLLSTTAGVPLYPDCEITVRPGCEGLNISPRL